MYILWSEFEVWCSSLKKTPDFNTARLRRGDRPTESMPQAANMTLAKTSFSFAMQRSICDLLLVHSSLGQRL